jgi:hypothetical protein
VATLLLAEQYFQPKKITNSSNEFKERDLVFNRVSSQNKNNKFQKQTMPLNFDKLSLLLEVGNFKPGLSSLLIILRKFKASLFI